MGPGSMPGGLRLLRPGIRAMAAVCLQYVQQLRQVHWETIWHDAPAESPH